MPVFTPTIIGAASLGMGIAQQAGAFGGGQQQGQVPGPQGNPMTQNSMAQAAPAQQEDMDLQMNPIGGLPGGGGWMG